MAATLATAAISLWSYNHAWSKVTVVAGNVSGVHEERGRYGRRWHVDYRYFDEGEWHAGDDRAESETALPKAGDAVEVRIARGIFGGSRLGKIGYPSNDVLSLLLAVCGLAVIVLPFTLAGSVILCRRERRLQL